MEFYASCPEGFESALADELKRLGLSHVRRLKGRATFEGELEQGYRACLWSRLASRVFVVLGRFEAQNADELYDSVYDIAWESIVRPGATIAITARGVTEQLRNTRFSALRAKDALCDRLAETTGRRADVDAADPDVHLLLSLRQRRASISLDLSGDPLFKRLPPAATRAGEGAHVLRPDYAALVLAQVGWTALCERELTADDYENEALPTLVDASCAGGGLLLEAVNILTDRAPGAARERWGFEGWQLHDAALWEQLLAEARERETAARERQARIVAVNIDPAARKTAERMVKCAGYKRFVDFCAAKPATVLDHAGAVAGAAVVADTTETPLSLMHDAMTLVGELRRAPELSAAPVAALTRDGLLARALHAEPERSIAVMPNNEEATIEVWPSLDHAAAAFEASTSADAEAEVADANEVNDNAANTPMPEPAATLDLGDGKPLPVLIPGAVRQPSAQERPPASQVGQARGRELLPRLRCRPTRLLRRHRPVRGLSADAGPLARHRRIRRAQDHRPRTGPGPHARHLGHRTAHPGCSGRARARQGPHALTRRLAVRQAGRRQGRLERAR